MYKLKIRVLAQRDIQEIVNYYDRINPKVADFFMEELFEEFAIITENPLLFNTKHKEARSCYLKRFPIGIHIVADDSCVHIIAVIHTSRNPAMWKNR